MGATSFVNVIVPGAAAGEDRPRAVERNATARADTPAAIFMSVPSLLDDDFDEPVRPAALRVAGAGDAGRVVRAHADEILARRGERRLCRGLPSGHVHTRGRRSKG